MTKNKKLTYDNGFEKIKYCSVCGSEDILLEALDNYTVVGVECNKCNYSYYVNLVEDEEDDED